MNAMILITLAGTFYLYAMAPGLGWLDSGEFTVAAHTLGFSHPPSHPLHGLLAGALGWILPGSVAYQINLFSLIAALAGLWMTFRLIEQSLETAPKARRQGIALTLCLLLALNPIFYIQALRAEVYSLMFFINAALLWQMRSSANDRHWERLALLVGLSFSVHYLPLLLITPALLLLNGRRRPILRLGWVVAGLTPFLYQWIREQTNPAFALSHFSDLTSFFRTLSGFTPATGHLRSLEMSGILPNLYRLFVVILTQTSLPLILAAFGGAILLWRQRRPLQTVALFWLCLAPLFLVVSIMMPEFRTGNPDNPDYGGYLSFALLGLILTAAPAINATVEFLEHHQRSAWIVPAALLLIFGQSLYVPLYGTLRHSQQAERYAFEVARTLPTHSVIIANGDDLAGPLFYQQLVEGWRRDLTLIVRLQLTTATAYQKARRHHPQALPPLSLEAATQQVDLIPVVKYNLEQGRAVYWHPAAPLKLDPQQTTVANALIRLGHHPGTEQSALKALSPPDNRLDAFVMRSLIEANYNNLALTYAHQGQRDAARTLWDQLLLHLPQNPTLLQNRALFAPTGN